MFSISKWITLAAVASCCVTDAFVPQAANTATPRQLVKDARATWTGRPSSARTPYAALRMGPAVAMPTPKTTAPTPTIKKTGFVDDKKSSELRPEDKYKVLLFNDNGNTREFVARSLVQVVGLPEDVAYQIMQQANDNGMAQVGIWHQEMADAYSSSLKERGLVSDIYPVD